MNEIKLYAVIVLYNKYIDSSNVILNYNKEPMKQLELIILDNSDNKYLEYNSHIAKSMNVQYYSMNGNVGLSKAYNFALNILKDKNKDDIIIWLDDDTDVKKEYFEVLIEYASDKMYQVFVPIIYGQDGVIYSPNEVGIFKGKYIKTSNQHIPKDKFNAINSCLAVRLNVYNNYRYDERLFIDCVDTKFFDDLRKQKIDFYVLPIKVYQNFFQRSDKLDEEKLWKRFKNRIDDNLIYSRISTKKNIITLIKIYGWGLVYGYKLKSINFMFNCIRYGTKKYFKYL